jgi:hypothetical protein
MTTITDLPPELVSQIVESLIDIGIDIDPATTPRIGENALWTSHKELSDPEVRSKWVVRPDADRDADADGDVVSTIPTISTTNFPVKSLRA